MLAKRIIPCLDIKDGQTVKGVNFDNLQFAGDPIELAKRYVSEGADELVFLDITATIEKRSLLIELVKKIAKEINIPFTVGGGNNSIQSVADLLKAGADKISINTAAVNNPELIVQLSSEFGSQCIVLATDVKCINNIWKVFTHGGRVETDKIALSWAIQASELGAGEILLTSMDHDGVKNGFALDITKKISSSVKIPVIASGGAGNMQHFFDIFDQGNADAALAASIFHFSKISIPSLKKFLKEKNIIIRD